MSQELKKITVKPTPVQVDADMTISEIIQKVPQASVILADFQLGCAGCALGSYETLRDGVMGHGRPQEDVDDILREINNASVMPRVYIDVDGIVFTEEAYDKVLEFMRSDPEKRKDLALRVDAVKNADRYQYFFDLVNKKKSGEREINQNDMRIFVSEENYEHFQNMCIDFQQTSFGAGFKVEERSFSLKDE